MVCDPHVAIDIGESLKQIVGIVHIGLKQGTGPISF